MNRFRPALQAASPLAIAVLTLILVSIGPAPSLSAPGTPAAANVSPPALHPADTSAPPAARPAAGDDDLPRARSGVAQYFIDRGNDLLDIVRLRIGVPHKAHAFGVKARVTSLAQLGFVWFEGAQYGLDRRALGQWHEGRTEGGVSLAYFSNVQNESGWGNRFLRADDPWTTFQARGIVRNDLYWDDGRRHPLSIGAELQTGILPGLDLGIYPGEVLDFLFGFLTLDYWDDDGLHVNRNLRRLERLRSDALNEVATEAPTAAPAPEAAPEAPAPATSDTSQTAPLTTPDDILPPVIDLAQTAPVIIPTPSEAAPAEPPAPQAAQPSSPAPAAPAPPAAPPLPADPTAQAAPADREPDTQTKAPAVQNAPPATPDAPPIQPARPEELKPDEDVPKDPRAQPPDTSSRQD
ncbi:MAG: hypothetical protein Kow0059_18750 [Candidatus Sumerlaeia bacterium]